MKRNALIISLKSFHVPLMPDDHQMFFSTEHILCIRHQFHAVFSFDADDICIIFDTDIDVPDRMTDPFRQRAIS